MNDDGLRRQSLYFILITVLIDAIGFGIIIPVMPELLMELMQVSSEKATLWNGYLAFCYAAMHFLFGPLIGNLSDQIGRRPVLLISLGALVIDYLIIGFASTIQILFVGRILTGICGATYSTANAYIADVTNEENRGKAFGMIGAAFGIGFILGPLIGGLLGELNSRIPFFAAAGLAGLNMIYGFYVLPESLKVENRRSFSFARANPVGAFRQIRNFVDIRWLMAVCFLLFLVHNVYPATWNFHGQGRYKWNSADIGLSLMAFGICAAIVQGGLIGRILKLFGENRTAFAGVFAGMIAYVGFAFSLKPWVLYCWIPLSAMAGLAMPAIKSMMSSRIAANAQGELQGVLSSLQGVANMIGPILMTQIYYYYAPSESGDGFYGAAFLLSAFIMLLAVLPLTLGIRNMLMGRNQVEPDGDQMRGKEQLRQESSSK